MPDKPMKWPVQPALTHGRHLYSGLQGLWPVWDGGGLTTADLTPNGLDGTLKNGVVWTISRGHALSFDGSNDYVEIADASALDIAGELTLSAWINVVSDPVTEDEGIVAKWRSQTGNLNERAYVMVVDTNGNAVGAVSSDGTFSAGSTANSVTGTSDITTGTWRHIAMTFLPSTSLKIYVDGREDGINTTSIISSLHNSPAPLWMGLFFDSTTADRYLEGLIDLVTIWNRALTATEIAFLHAFPYAMIEPRGGRLGVSR